MKRIGLVLLTICVFLTAISLTACGGAKYKVTFDGNGGTFISGNEIQTVKENGTVIPPVYVKTGYSFEGWDGSFLSVCADITIKAKWTANTYTILYVGGEAEGDTQSSSHVYDTEKNLTINGFIKTNYHFEGWALTENGEVKYVDGAEVKNLTAIDDAQITLYAVWSVHDWGEWIERTSPTCTEDGEETRTCKDCAHTESRILSKTGHNFCEWTTVTAATCTETGLEKRTCTVCGHEETQEIAALGHDWEGEFTIDIPATCEEAGSKSIHCIRCGEKKDITVIPAIGHNYIWTVTTAPTEAEDGTEIEICQNDNSHTRETRIAYATGTAGLEYTLQDGNYSVTGYTGVAEEIVIPAYHNRTPVESIGVNAFHLKDTLISVHILSGVTSIEMCTEIKVSLDEMH